MDLGEKDCLVAVAKLAEQEEDGDGDGGGGEGEEDAGVEQTEEGNAEPVN
jgi:hypothetical protein